MSDVEVGWEVKTHRKLMSMELEIQERLCFSIGSPF